MAHPSITLYLDVVSPFAYIAYHLARNDPVFKACDITYVPIFLGGVMKYCNNPPPIKIKNKDKWINVERLRWAKLFSVPMAESLPGDFPPLTLPNMRALCALSALSSKEQEQEQLIRAFDALYHAYFVDSKQTHKPDVLPGVLQEALGEELSKKVLDMMGKEGKELLAKNTDAAIEDGAFGLPWYKCTNAEGKTESFWGVDHLGQVCSFLSLEKPRIGGWKSML